MSRQIDLSKSLSDEDRAYLEARNRQADIAMAAGGEASSLTSSGKSFDATASAEDLLAEVPNTGDVGTLDDDARMSTANAGSDTEAGEYDDMTVAQLRDELERRGLSTSGNKSDLIDRLEADDEE